jgi:hypothetical protein
VLLTTAPACVGAVGVDPRYDDTTYDHPAGIMDQQAPAMTDFGKCLPEMIMLCGGTYTSKCIACAHGNAAALKRAGCTNDDVEAICNTAAMAVVNVSVTPPVFTAVGPGGGYPAPIMGLTVTRLTNFSTTAPIGYGKSHQVIPGLPIPLGASVNPHDNYIFTGTIVWPAGLNSAGTGSDGTAMIETWVLQLRAQVDIGPIDTTVSFHYQNYQMRTDDPSGSENNLTFIPDGGTIASVSGSWSPGSLVLNTGTNGFPAGSGWGGDLKSGWRVYYEGGP